MYDRYMSAQACAKAGTRKKIASARHEEVAHQVRRFCCCIVFLLFFSFPFFKMKSFVCVRKSYVAKLLDVLSFPFGALLSHLHEAADRGHGGVRIIT